MSNKYKNNPNNKRYYWLQLKTDFFDQKEIKLLRKIAGGDTYTIIYLKMLLASLKDEGRLYFEAIGDDFAEEIALLIDEDTENVSITLKFLQAKGLIEIEEQDEYFLNRVPEMIGSESYSAERVRRYRQKKLLQNDVMNEQCNDSALQSNTHVTKSIYKEDIKIDNKNIDQSSSKEADKVSLKNRFESIWELYPKKQGKTKAFESYKRAIKDGVTDEQIIKGINDYKKQIELQRTDTQYIKQGSTFFNQRNYLDEFVTGKNNKQVPAKKIEKEWQEHYERAGKIDLSKDIESFMDDLPY
ncbi:phage replisome organizer N-terminal domain-containing protein [Vagococcus luciliae]|uniref:Phage replisome organiser N-terminal domain-containing protein n=1 Tax=Vagococcus luciliae TaxID=2920380 RepID=A0ABY5P182_9ENTE|nr:phage replisome organizer N-terminal domain-containing protein [Vagococcus luciliae]UUV99582.1 hypothetical protein G314FT_17430 [Vagococcus luciliae]